jgi:hypothetical protein
MDLTMNELRKCILVLMTICWQFLYYAPVSTASQTGQKIDSSTALVQKVINCLVAADFVQAKLKSLGLNIGDKAMVKYHHGSIKGMMPTPTAIHVIVYSADHRRGWLLIAEPIKGSGYMAIRNGYRLLKTDSRWAADEGNGGVASYQAMSKFSTILADTPDYEVELTPAHSGCGPIK